MFVFYIIIMILEWTKHDWMPLKQIHMNRLMQNIFLLEKERERERERKREGGGFNCHIYSCLFPISIDIWIFYEVADSTA